MQEKLHCDHGLICVQVQLHAEHFGWSSDEPFPHRALCILVHQWLHAGGNCGVCGGQYLPHGRLYGASAAPWGMCTPFGNFGLIVAAVQLTACIYMRLALCMLLCSG